MGNSKVFYGNKKICFDLKLFGIKEENFKYIKINECSFSYKSDEKNEEYLEFLKIWEKYYNSVIDMISLYWTKKISGIFF